MDALPPADMVDAPTRAAIETLLARYCHCIDNDAFEQWPDFFLEDGCYQVTTRENHRKGWPIGIIYCDSRGMMVDRVTALRRAIVFEPHGYRHMISAILISRSDAGFCHVESNFHVLRTAADGTMTSFCCGRYVDEIAFLDGAARFKSRIVILDSARIDTLLVLPL